MAYNILGELDMSNIILKNTKKNKNIVYGAQSLARQVPGYMRRGTSDFDILAKHPKKSATEVEKELDKAFGGDYFYTKPALHPNTTKLMFRGGDMRKGTADDEGIADFTMLRKPEPKTIMINGIIYVKLSEIRKDKLKALKDKKYAFRHAKDLRDINSIRLNEKLRRTKI